MYYYNVRVKGLFDDDICDCVCGWKEELKKNDFVVIDYNGLFTIACISSPCDELKVLTGLVDAKPTLQKVEVEEYLNSRKAQTEKILLLKEMENISKEVKLVEQMKKFAGADERIKELMSKYQGL